ncbi:hypothetical protein ACWPM1_02555 [Tsuneonella sp. HG249]
MIYFRFHEAGGQAVVITNDRSGSNLPKSSFAWKADGQTDVSKGGRGRFGETSDEIIATIERDGFFIGSRPLVWRAAGGANRQADEL